MDNAESILDFAIAREQEAHDFYLELAKRTQTPGMSRTFEQFAREEAGHRKKLEAVKAGKIPALNAGEVLDLSIAEYMVEVDPGGDLDYQASLILAMKREKMAFKLYSDLAAKVEDPELKSLFLGLAQEEARHKLRFELEYDEQVLKDN